MAVPFMRAYTQLLVATCHRRGAHAIGGMSAFIPNRREPEVTANALAKVREDKEREAGDGFDGTWVAHPDLVPVAGRVFDRVLGDRPNQKDRRPATVRSRRRRCSTSSVPGGRITEAGVAPGRQRRAALPRRLAARQRRGRDRQPHGGRGDGRDQPLPAVAVAARTARRSTTDGRSTTPATRAIRDEELGRAIGPRATGRVAEAADLLDGLVLSRRLRRVPHARRPTRCLDSHRR